jgi:hypothetical protein
MPLERRVRPAPWPYSLEEFWTDPEDPQQQEEPEVKPRRRALAR